MKPWNRIIFTASPSHPCMLQTLFSAIHIIPLPPTPWGQVPSLPLSRLWRSFGVSSSGKITLQVHWQPMYYFHSLIVTSMKTMIVSFASLQSDTHMSCCCCPFVPSYDLVPPSPACWLPGGFEHVCMLPALHSLLVDPTFWDEFDLPAAVRNQATMQKLKYLRQALNEEGGALKWVNYNYCRWRDRVAHARAFMVCASFYSCGLISSSCW